MRDQCVQAVTAAATAMGRTLTQADLRGIEDRVRTNRRLLAEKDVNAYRAMPPEVQLQEAAKMAADQLMAEKLRKKHNAVRSVEAEYKFKTLLPEIAGRVGGSHLRALDYLLSEKQDGRGGVMSVERRGQAVADLYIGKLGSLLDLGEQGNLLNLFADPKSSRDIVYELMGKDSGNAMAKQAAEQTKVVLDDIVAQLKYNGVPINYLEGYGLPTRHASELVYRAGKDAWVEKAKTIFRVPFKEDGARMTDAEFTRFLGESWYSIAHNGAASAGDKPAVVGGVSLAPPYAKHRQLHFRGPDEWLAYHSEFSTGNAFQILLSHVESASRDIAMTEMLTANPQHMFAKLADWAKEQDSRADTGGKGVSNFNARAERLAKKYKFMTGEFAPTAQYETAVTLRNYRNLKVASSMGSLITSMVADQGTMIAIARQNGAAVADLYSFLAQEGFSKSARETTRALGLASEVAAMEVSRWGEQNMATGVTGKLASTVMKISGANFLNEVEKNAFNKVMSNLYARLAQTDFAKLDAGDQARLRAKGVTDTDWAVWRKAIPDEAGGSKFLTPAAIEAIPDAVLAPLGDPARLKREASLKLLGAIGQETDTAILQPNMSERFEVQTLAGGIDPNSTSGEIWKSVAQFKSFGWAFARRHWDRAIANQQAGGSRYGYGLAVVGLTTLFGGMGVLLGDIANGKDPREVYDENDPTQLARFGRDAFLKGGGLGFYSDIIFGKASADQGLAEVFGGPMVGDVSKLWKMGTTALDDELSGEEKNRKYAGKLVDLAKSNTPFQNLWYTKAATNRWLFNQAQESVNPGYADRLKQSAEKNQAPYFWQPDEASPSRAPNFGNVFANPQ